MMLSRNPLAVVYSRLATAGAVSIFTQSWRNLDVEEKLPSWKQMKRLWTSISFFDIT